MSKNEFSSIDEALDMLSKGIVDITFIKKTDGGVRTMHSTLNKLWIPYGEYDTVNSVVAHAIAYTTELLPVWDLSVSGWRSFYLGSTIEIQPSLVFGDTTEIIESMVQEKSEAEELSDEATAEIIESMTSLLKKKIATSVEEAPSKMAEFTANKIKQMVTNIIKQHIMKR